jgi:hypothetical protein
MRFLSEKAKLFREFMEYEVKSKIYRVLPQKVRWKGGYLFGEDKKTIYTTRGKKRFELHPKAHPRIISFSNPTRYLTLDRDNQTFRYALTGKKAFKSPQKVNLNDYSGTPLIICEDQATFFNMIKGKETKTLPQKVSGQILDKRNLCTLTDRFIVPALDGLTFYELPSGETAYRVPQHVKPGFLQAPSLGAHVKDAHLNVIYDLKTNESHSFPGEIQNVIFSLNRNWSVQSLDGRLIYGLETGKIESAFPASVEIGSEIMIDRMPHIRGKNLQHYFDAQTKRISVRMPEGILAPIHQVIAPHRNLALGEDQQTLHHLVFRRVVHCSVYDLEEILKKKPKKRR